MDRDAHELARTLVRRVAVVGAGWAGLASAVEATEAGAQVTLFDMAPEAGGRARTLGGRGNGDMVLDNGQHICIGAYTETLRLLAKVGVAESQVFLRMPLTLVNAAGEGLRLGRGAPLPAFALAVLRRHGWRWHDRLALLRTAARWRRQGFRCAPTATVDELCASLPACVREDFIEPLCIAALNTSAAEASGAVFLRVLNDALATGPGSADLLLPRIDLGAVFPVPALAWLQRAGAVVRLGERVNHLAATGTGTWSADGTAFDRVVVAASAVEAARLVGQFMPEWAARASALRYEPIVTVYARSDGARLPEPMLTLRSDADRPAQFVFDRGRLGGPAGLLALVASGASAWLHRGLVETERAALAQARHALSSHLHAPLEAVRTIVEKRATFACTPALVRPAATVRPFLFAAGDYVEGPYPATLEGAVRSGVAAARAAMA